MQSDDALRDLIDARADGLPVFAVISWGCAATTWVARALNLHRDISCLDGLRAKLAASLGVPLPDPVAYLRLVRAHAEGYPLAGDIHSLHYADAPIVRAAFADAVRLCSVVRDPLPRIASFMGLARQFDYAPAWCDTAYLRDLPRAAAILPLLGESPERPFFAHAALACNGIIHEHAIGPVYRMEDLTTDRAAFRALVGHLSAGALDADDNYLDRVQGLGAVNRHAPATHRLSTATWQHAVFEALLDPEARRLYRDLGYAV